jgi:hypothetical protein
MKKIDLKTQYKDLYKPPAKGAVVVEVPPLTFLMAHGEGDPNTAPAYKEAVAALFTLSYTLKFLVKKGELGIDYGVMPLEGLWWTNGDKPVHLSDKKSWKWTAMILQPDFVDMPLVEEARGQAIKTKGLPGLSEVEFATVHEGRSAQVLHTGPYSAEVPTIEALHRFIGEQGGRPRGKHHEIYLSDPSKTAPEKLKTIIRQPFA